MLTDEDNGTMTTIATNAIAVHNPSSITFVAPATLPAGNYKLSITTHYTANKVLLKEPRTYLFDYVLTV